MKAEEQKFFTDLGLKGQYHKIKKEDFLSRLVSEISRIGQRGHGLALIAHQMKSKNYKTACCEGRKANLTFLNVTLIERVIQAARENFDVYCATCDYLNPGAKISFNEAIFLNKLEWLLLLSCRYILAKAGLLCLDYLIRERRVVSMPASLGRRYLLTTKRWKQRGVVK